LTSGGPPTEKNQTAALFSSARSKNRNGARAAGERTSPRKGKKKNMRALPIRLLNQKKKQKHERSRKERRWVRKRRTRRTGRRGKDQKAGKALVLGGGRGHRQRQGGRWGGGRGAGTNGRKKKKKAPGRVAAASWEPRGRGDQPPLKSRPHGKEKN